MELSNVLAIVGLFIGSLVLIAGVVYGTVAIRSSGLLTQAVEKAGEGLERGAEGLRRDVAGLADGIGMSAQVTQESIAKAAQATQDSIAKAAQATQDSIAKAAQATQDSIAKAAQATQDSMAKVAEGVQETIKYEAQETRELIRGNLADLGDGIRAGTQVTQESIVKTAQVIQETMRQVSEGVQETLRVEGEQTRAAIHALSLLQTGAETPVGNCLIHGTGETGRALATSIVNKDRYRSIYFDKLNLVGFIDDDPQEVGAVIEVRSRATRRAVKVPVLKTSEDTESVIRDKNIGCVLLAMEEPQEERRREVIRACDRAKIPCYEFNLSFTRLS